MIITIITNHKQSLEEKKNHKQNILSQQLGIKLNNIKEP